MDVIISLPVMEITLLISVSTWLRNIRWTWWCHTDLDKTQSRLIQHAFCLTPRPLQLDSSRTYKQILISPLLTASPSTLFDAMPPKVSNHNQLCLFTKGSSGRRAAIPLPDFLRWNFSPALQRNAKDKQEKQEKRAALKASRPAKADWKDSTKKKQVGVADMTLLTKITNEAINENLQKRWQNAEIYVCPSFVPLLWRVENQNKPKLSLF